MLITNHNYNSLGRLGPHYERPEYRPPQEKNDPQLPASSAGTAKGDRSTLSVKNSQVSIKRAREVPAARVTLDSARDLTAATCELITELPPRATGRLPHGGLRSHLLRPVYV